MRRISTTWLRIVIWCLIINILRTVKNTNLGWDSGVWCHRWKISHWQKGAYEKHLAHPLHQNVGNGTQRGKRRREMSRYIPLKNSHIWLNRGKDITVVKQVLKLRSLGKHTGENVILCNRTRTANLKRWFHNSMDLRKHNIMGRGYWHQTNLRWCWSLNEG